jgi:signal transduction histidine kinase
MLKIVPISTPMRRPILVGALLLLAGVCGFIDYVTGPELVFTSVYLLPVSVAAWYGSRASGLLFSFVMTGVYLIADVFSRTSYISVGGRAWNTGVQLAVFVCVSLLIERLRSRLDSEKLARNAAELALERLRAIQLVTDAALANMSLEDLLVELLSRVRGLLHADCAVLLLLDEETATLFVRALDGLRGARPGPTPLGVGVEGRIALTREPILVRDVHETTALGPVRSLLGVPLIVEGHTIGVLEVGDLAGIDGFQEEALTLLQLVADRVAPAVDRARLLEQVQEGRRRLQHLAERRVAVQEAERRRIARELHDEIGQVLTAIKISLGQIASNGKDPSKITKSVALVDRAIDEVRRLALDLRPSVLDDLGLRAALRWYLDRHAESGILTAELSATELRERFPADVETACFRVAQEALTNVVRHANAHRTWVELKERTHELELSIRDDGAGFDVSSARARSSGGACAGLSGMEERVGLAGGRLQIRSAPGEGTIVRAFFPLSSSGGAGL